MTPERTRRARELFDLAVELPVGERATFLDAGCGGDEELRREVASLLAFDERADFDANSLVNGRTAHGRFGAGGAAHQAAHDEP